MIASCSLRVTFQLVALLPILAAPAASRAAERLPGQIYNRMVYVRAADGAETFVNMPNHYDVGSPSISPDGKWIAFDANTIGPGPQREAWLVDVDGSNLRKLTNGSCPRWSPDGKRLLLSRATPMGKRAVNYDIYSYELATNKESRVCDGRFPDWSPDGKQIVFGKDGVITANTGEHPGSKLWIALANGSGGTELCDGNWPSWSPDGKTIAYCLQDKQPSEIWTIELDTKKRTKIALGFYRAQWLGDSKRFVCNGAFPIPGESGYSHCPAMFYLDKPLKPRFFGNDRDNPWSPCFSRDGKMVALIVDSQKRRGEDDSGR